MTYFMSMLLFGLVGGLVIVASSPSPYFGALGLVMVAGVGSGVMIGHGGSFFSLVLFLIYLGGMLVVFAYSAALAAEPFPEGLGSQGVVVYVGFYVGGVMLVLLLLCKKWAEYTWVPMDELVELWALRGDMSGAGEIYALGGVFLLAAAWVLFLTLFVVLELTRGLKRGTLRAP